MAEPKLPKAYDQYGSSMGRRGNEHSKHDPDHLQPFKFQVYRMHLDRGGYDCGGAYWGTGEPVYRYVADNVWIESQERDADGPEGYRRAYSRDEVKENLREAYPNCRFYR